MPLHLSELIIDNSCSLWFAYNGLLFLDSRVVKVNLNQPHFPTAPNALFKEKSE